MEAPTLDGPSRGPEVSLHLVGGSGCTPPVLTQLHSPLWTASWVSSLLLTRCALGLPTHLLFSSISSGVSDANAADMSCCFCPLSTLPILLPSFHL